MAARSPSGATQRDRARRRSGDASTHAICSCTLWRRSSASCGDPSPSSSPAPDRMNPTVGEDSRPAGPRRLQHVSAGRRPSSHISNGRIELRRGTCHPPDDDRTPRQGAHRQPSRPTAPPGARARQVRVRNQRREPRPAGARLPLFGLSDGPTPPGRSCSTRTAPDLAKGPSPTSAPRRSTSPPTSRPTCPGIPRDGRRGRRGRAAPPLPPLDPLRALRPDRARRRGTIVGFSVSQGFQQLQHDDALVEPGVGWVRQLPLGWSTSRYIISIISLLAGRRLHTHFLELPAHPQPHQRWLPARRSCSRRGTRRWTVSGSAA